MGRLKSSAAKSGGTVTLKLTQAEARSLLLALTNAMQGGPTGKLKKLK